MLDLNFIRKNPEAVRTAVREKHERVDIDQLVKLDADRRELIYQSEVLRKQLNEGSKRISQLKKQGQDASNLVEEMRALSDKIKDLEKRLEQLTPEIDALLLRIPNIPAPDVPKGEDASANVTVRNWGKRREFNFQPKPH
ncbi:MAG TPA: serine--tRNA ligase, partial [Candidatus Hypogeohydataceae bacterium YC40]